MITFMTFAAVAAAVPTTVSTELPREDAILAITGNQAPDIGGVPVGSAMDVIFEDGGGMATGLNFLFVLFLFGIIWKLWTEFSDVASSMLAARSTFLTERKRSAKVFRLEGAYLQEYMDMFQLPAFWNIQDNWLFWKQWCKSKSLAASMSGYFDKKASALATQASRDSVKYEKY